LDLKGFPNRMGVRLVSSTTEECHHRLGGLVVEERRVRFQHPCDPVSELPGRELLFCALSI